MSEGPVSRLAPPRSGRLPRPRCPHERDERLRSPRSVVGPVRTGRGSHGSDGVEAREGDCLMQAMNAVDELRGQGRMTWVEAEQGWIAAPDEIVVALSTDGFEECKHELTTSRRDSRPGGGVWQGINTQTGVVASAVWVHRQRWPQALVFITVEGEPLKGDASRREGDPHHEDGGEG
jgi:hypothetical protein